MKGLSDKITLVTPKKNKVWNQQTSTCRSLNETCRISSISLLLEKRISKKSFYALAVKKELAAIGKLSFLQPFTAS